jgi:uncharacterized protein
MRLYLCFIAVFLSFACKTPTVSSGIAEKYDENTLLWEITGNGLKKPSFLYGTFHMMCKEDILLSENLRKAVKQSDEVYFELDLDDIKGSINTLPLMNMSDGKKLNDLLTPEEYTKVETFFKDTLRSSLSSLQRLKPLFLMSLFYSKMISCRNMSGVETEIMRIAKEQGKTINGFETVAFQASMLDVIPYQKQAQELLKAIDSLEEYKINFASMLSVYKHQQLDSIEGLFNKTEFGLEENMEVLLYKRNRDWVAKLGDILPSKSVFIGVGSGHLVGEKGVIALLRKKGYSVRPLNNN